MIPLSEIRAAASRIAGHVHRTPIFTSAQIGDRAGVRLFLKCESFQKTGSFKPRGALNKILSLAEGERARGLVTVSAGNHAAAVAWAARIAGASAVVVMPAGAPASKIEAVRGYGAEIVFHEDRATLFDRLNEVREARGLTFVHPFDDPVVLAGAGTVGLEIAEDLSELDAVIVPVGGGGLLGGVASGVKQMRPSPGRRRGARSRPRPRAGAGGGKARAGPEACRHAGRRHDAAIRRRVSLWRSRARPWTKSSQ